MNDEIRSTNDETKATAAAVKAQPKSAGFTETETEVQFTKSALSAATRYADVVGTNPITGEPAIVQIGKLASDGLPVTRELDAIADILSSPNFNAINDALYFVEKGTF